MMAGAAVPPLAMRRAGPDDAGRLALLAGATFLATFAHDHPGDAIVAHAAGANGEAAFRAALIDPDQAVWLVETPLAAPVGYAQLTPPSVAAPTEAGDLELKRLYLLPGYAGGGWGRRLVEAVIDEARARGGRRLLLSVYEHNHGAMRFYRRFGFEPTGYSQAFGVGDYSSTDLIFVRPLEPSASLA